MRGCVYHKQLMGIYPRAYTQLAMSLGINIVYTILLYQHFHCKELSITCILWDFRFKTQHVGTVYL